MRILKYRAGSYIICLLMVITLVTSCKKGGVPRTITSYQDGFENAAEITDLLAVDDSRWSGFQQESPSLGNLIEIDTLIFHSDSSSLKITAEASTKKFVSKADVYKEGLNFKKGETIYFSAWYYIVGNENIESLFLFDLEESRVKGADPGIRLMMSGGNDFLSVERGKFNQSTISQPADSKIAFPRDQWVHVELELLLSQKEEGSIKLWQDNTLIIDEADVQTLPKDFLVFIHGTTGTYDRMQVGVTANTKNVDLLMYVDDVEIRLK